jgi:hypothetical protein
LDIDYGRSAALSLSVKSEIVFGNYRTFINTNKEYQPLVDCVVSFGKSKNWNISNFIKKQFNLDGTDDIARFTYYMQLDDVSLNGISKCIKQFNGGNFNAKIYKFVK